MVTCCKKCGSDEFELHYYEEMRELIVICRSCTKEVLTVDSDFCDLSLLDGDEDE